MTGHPSTAQSGRVDGWMVGQASRQTVSDLQRRYESAHLRSQLRASRLTVSFCSSHLLSLVDDLVVLKTAIFSLSNNNNNNSNNNNNTTYESVGQLALTLL